MELVVEAEKAEDIGAAFSKFKEALPDQATEITALISELWAISSALRDLHTAIQSREYGRNIHYIADDLRVVRTSVSYTLKDVFDIIGDINSNSRGNLPTIGAYRQTWKDIYLHFRKESPSSLCIRLETYRTFIMELGSIMKRYGFAVLPATSANLQRNGPDPRIIDDMRESIEDLLDVQDRRLAEEFGGMSLGRQGQSIRIRWNSIMSTMVDRLYFQALHHADLTKEQDSLVPHNRRSLQGMTFLPLRRMFRRPQPQLPQPLNQQVPISASIIGPCVYLLERFKLALYHDLAICMANPPPCSAHD